MSIQRWTAEDDAKLFLTLLETHDVKVDYQRLADAFGNGRTASAVKQRIQGLKRKVKDVDGSAKASSGAASPVTKSVTGGTKRKVAAAPAGGRGRDRPRSKKEDENKENDAAEDDEEGVDPKRVKKEKKDDDNDGFDFDEYSDGFGDNEVLGDMV